MGVYFEIQECSSTVVSVRTVIGKQYVMLNLILSILLHIEVPSVIFHHKYAKQNQANDNMTSKMTSFKAVENDLILSAYTPFFPLCIHRTDVCV